MADDDDPRNQISRLEAQIEELANAINRCRRFILLSQASMGAGGLSILAVTTGAIRFTAAAMLCSIAAIIGGIVGFGSNTSTAKQHTAAMQAAEAQRAALIGSIDLRVVRGGEKERSAEKFAVTRTSLEQYFKFGPYRDPAGYGVTVYLDNLARGRSYEDVDPTKFK